MKILFLDIDGVLNCSRTTERWQGLVGIDAKLAARLSKLQQETGAGVVVSSTWRLSRNWRSALRRNGVTGIIGKTPDLPGHSRGEEIDAWLREHPFVRTYAILDDAADMLSHHPLFKTSFSKGGLTEKIAEQVRVHLMESDRVVGGHTTATAALP